jgi:hypothetical protein
MQKGFTHARLACGCRVGFRDGVDASPYTVFVSEKAATCQISLHVRNLSIYDFREALRPPTRISPAEHEDFEEEN